MRALRTFKQNNNIATEIQSLDIPTPNEGEVLIQAEYSSLNYKDALGITGKGQIFKKLPITGGIDVSGTIKKSNDSKFKVGDPVLVTGCGLGETHDGGYSEIVLESAHNTVRRPGHLSAREAMIYGTAGFTAALCVERMIQNGQTIDMGPILITGASGGVGQFAISFLSKLGFEVHALTSKQELAPHLTKIGAHQVIFTSQLELGTRALETVRFGGAIDNLGGESLALLLAHINLWGNVACVGLAASYELKTTVMPLILRGVSLLGISSNNTPKDLRLKIWQRLATDLKPKNIETFVSEVIGLEDIFSRAEKMLARQTQGRTLILF